MYMSWLSYQENEGVVMALQLGKTATREETAIRGSVSGRLEYLKQLLWWHTQVFCVFLCPNLARP